MREQTFMSRVAMFCNGILRLAWSVVFFVWFVGNSNGSQGFEQRKIGVDPGPSVVATKGEVWPKPQFKTTNDGFFIIRPNYFQFKVVGETCEILEKALQRYNQDLKSHDKIRRSVKSLYQNETRRRFLINDDSFKGYLDELSVDLRSPCESLPHVDMDERYELRINTDDFPHQAFLFSQSIWGLLRGLETWSQLIYSPSDHNALIINGTSILDFPKFTHRGLLIDTSRHFLPVKTIYSMLDAMAMSKLNVLHWHIVDDQSFPYQSKTFPDLSGKGAYAFTHVYTQAHVRDVIAYAALRGIRVIPEFDTPGHTRSWGEAYPELLTKCYSKGEPDGSLGPMDPIATETYSFMKKMLKEITETFPDRYVHLGGDEVEFQCWASNPKIAEFMKENNLSPKQLEGIFVNKIIKIATNFSAIPIVWQEVFDDGVALPNNTLIQIWKGDYYTKLSDITAKGYTTLLSSCWYLDSLSSGGDWRKFYLCDPHDFRGSERQKKLVIGGEACMWGEVVDVNNVISRTWPRACATAEKLWSSVSYANIEDVSRRLEEHTCRMNRRKIPAQPPNGPGYCVFANFA